MAPTKVEPLWKGQMGFCVPSEGALGHMKVVSPVRQATFSHTYFSGCQERSPASRAALLKEAQLSFVKVWSSPVERCPVELCQGLE